MTVQRQGEAAKAENAVRVCVRVRPVNDRERSAGAVSCVAFDTQNLQVVLHAPPNHNFHKNHGKPRHGFAFDHSYGPKGSSREVYADCVAPLVENVAKGYNACVLAYGQTCSGKTFTMSGGTGYEGVQDKGIIPEAIEHLFVLLDELQEKETSDGQDFTFRVTASAMEIYNEELRDLGLGFGGTPGQGTDVPMTPRSINKRSKSKIDIRDNRDRATGFATEVVGLTEAEFKTSKDLLRFFSRAGRHRTTTSTMMNDRSSRSHEIFTVTVEQTSVQYLGQDRTGITMSEFSESGGFKQTKKTMSRLHLVDLAGSERVKKSGVGGKELKEASSINSGLLTLGNVICALADRSEGKSSRHIPYRDVKLTRVLQDSLGGNSMTTLISCISPADSDFDESFNTLQYASRACKIKNVELSATQILTTEEGLPFAAESMSTLLQHLDDTECRPRLGLRRWDDCNDLGEELVEVPATDRDERCFAQDHSARKAAAVARRNRAAQYDMLRRKALGSFGARVKNFKGNMTITGNAVTRRARIGRDGELGTPRPKLPAPSQPRNLMGSAESAKRGRASGSGIVDLMRKSRAEEKTNAALSETDDQARDTKLTDQVPQAFQQRDGAMEEATCDDSEAPQDLKVGEILQPLINVKIDATNDMACEEHPELEAKDGKLWQPCISHTETVANQNDDHGIITTGQNSECVEAQRSADQQPEVSHRLTGDSNSCLKPGMNVKDFAEETKGKSSMASDSTNGDQSSTVAQSDQDTLQQEEDAEVLVRFCVSQNIAVTVHKACTKEDFEDVVSLLPHNTPLPSSDRMIYLLARVIEDMETGEVGRAVGCLMASIGTCMISSCIYSFKDPQEVMNFHTEERVELWGLQIPQPGSQNIVTAPSSNVVLPGVWCSADRLTMSIGLLFGLCCYADDNDIRAGFCVPRPQLLDRWMSSGVPMHGLEGKIQLIYPPNAHDFHYYQSSTVAYFLVDEVIDTLGFILEFL